MGQSDRHSQSIHTELLSKIYCENLGGHVRLTGLEGRWVGPITCLESANRPSDGYGTGTTRLIQNDHVSGT